jgi:hypothetical protein
LKKSLKNSNELELPRLKKIGDLVLLQKTKYMPSQTS